MITAIDKRTALILIDLQTGVTNTSPLAHPTETVVSNAAKLAAAFRKEKLLVILVHVNPIGARWTLARAQESSMPKEAIAQQQLLQTWLNSGFFSLAPELDQQPSDIIISKSGWNAFYKTGLNKLLKENKIKGIVLGGVSTSIGVEGTARAASERGFNITFAEDAMTDRLLEAHDNSVKHIFPRIGEIGDTATILSYLEKRS